MRNALDESEFHHALGKQPERPTGLTFRGLRTGQRGQARLQFAAELGGDGGRLAPFALQGSRRSSLAASLPQAGQGVDREPGPPGDEIVGERYSRAFLSQSRMAWTLTRFGGGDPLLRTMAWRRRRSPASSLMWYFLAGIPYKIPVLKSYKSKSHIYHSIYP